MMSLPEPTLRRMGPGSAGGAGGKSLIREARETHLAMDLIALGARLQFLEAETSLSRDRLIKLYQEIRGVSPPKGLLPFSTDWFMTSLSNIHSSMFYNIRRFIVIHGGCNRITGITKSYRLYLEQVKTQGSELVLDFTRAWTLIRFFDSDMLKLSTFTCCMGRFVSYAHDPQSHDPQGHYVCVLCRPPSRAGKKQKVLPEAPRHREIVSIGKAAATSSQWLAEAINAAHL